MLSKKFETSRPEMEVEWQRWGQFTQLIESDAEFRQRVLNWLVAVAIVIIVGLSWFLCFVFLSCCKPSEVYFRHYDEMFYEVARLDAEEKYDKLLQVEKEINEKPETEEELDQNSENNLRSIPRMNPKPPNIDYTESENSVSRSTIPKQERKPNDMEVTVTPMINMRAMQPTAPQSPRLHSAQSPRKNNDFEKPPRR